MKKPSKRAHHILLNQAHLHTRLIVSVLVGVAVALWVPHSWVGNSTTRLLLGWNVSTWLYLILAAHMVMHATHDSMRARAEAEDEGRTLLLILVMLTAVASLVAIVAELLVVKGMSGFDKLTHVGLAGATILASWAFTHTMFALHYAHDFYAARADGQDGGLVFPGTADPSYADFIYFAAIIGTSGQTADVSFSSKRMRHIGTAHCVLAFFFNTTVLALTINIAAGLL